MVSFGLSFGLSLAKVAFGEVTLVFVVLCGHERLEGQASGPLDRREYEIKVERRPLLVERAGGRQRDRSKFGSLRSLRVENEGKHGEVGRAQCLGLVAQDGDVARPEDDRREHQARMAGRDGTGRPARHGSVVGDDKQGDVAM